MATSTQEPAAFSNLSIFGSLFATLSALYGAYLVLFVVAIWATYQHRGTSQKRLRMVTTTLFIVLFVHYLSRAINYGRARLFHQPANEEALWTIPLTFVNDITSTAAGVILDGLLAWRFYVTWDRARWAIIVPSTAIFLNTLLGLAGNFLYISYYHNPVVYNMRLKLITLEVHAAWAWCMLCINTALTILIIWRIVRVSRKARPLDNSKQIPYPYNVAVEAIAESALVTWIGLIIYGISSLAPEGRFTTNRDVGTIVDCALPFFFGISQCLITVRLGLASNATHPVKDSSNHTACSCEKSSRPPIAVTIRQETDVDECSSHAPSMLGEKQSHPVYRET